MADTTLDRLVVEIEGKTAGYQQALNRVQAQTRGTTQRVQQASQKIEGYGRSLQSFAASAAGALATIGAATSFRDLFQTFSVQERAELTLRAALEANGRQVQKTFADYQKFASALQAVTVHGDEGTLAMLQQAESLGITGAAAKRAVKNAIALADANGMSARSTLRMTVLLEQGQTTMLSRYLPAIRSVTEESDKVRLAQEQLAKMFAVSESVAKTASGKVEQLSNSWGDFKEQLGATVAEGLIPAVEQGKKVTAWLQELDPAVKRGIVYTGGLTTALITVATTGPLVVSALNSVRLATVAFATNPITLWTAAITAAAAAGAGYAAEISGINDMMVKLNKELARTDRFAARARGTLAHGVETRLGGIANIQDERDRLAALNSLLSDITFANNDVVLAGERLQAQRDKVRNRPFGFGISTVSPLAAFAPGLIRDVENFFGKEPALAALDAALARNQKDLDAYGEAVGRVRQAHDKLAEALQKREGADRLARDFARAGQQALAAAGPVRKFAETLIDFGKGAPGMQKELDRLSALGAKITEQYRTPQEVFADRQAELNRLLETGSISVATYNRALADAQERLHGVGEAARSTQAAVFSLSAVGFGSAAALQRIQQYRDMLSGGRPGYVGTQPPSPLATTPKIISGAEAKAIEEQKQFWGQVIQQLGDLIDVTRENKPPNLEGAGL